MNKTELEKRKLQMTAQARAEIAKTKIVQFRLDPANILKLYELAEKNRKPLGTMIRDWTIERMKEEESDKPRTELEKIEKRLSSIEKKLTKQLLP